MKSQIKNCLLVTFFALMTVFSCQNEETEFIGPDETETIQANSTLANFMRSTSANSVSSDNVLDNSDCFSVELPVTIVVSDITITITTQDDLDELEDLLEDLEVDVPEFVFPITIIYSDYNELVIENQDQLDALLEQCFNDDDTIECIDFVYPISFSVFNTQFVLIDTILIESDEELYDFLERLEDENDTLIVSLNFPVSLEYANGETVTVDSNQELAEVIQAAAEECEDDNYIPCTVDDIRAYLKECSWIIDDEFNDFDDFEITFEAEGTLTIESPNINTVVTGMWSVTNTDNGTILKIFELSAFQGDIGGEYLITECREDRFKLVRGDFNVVLERNCETDINCSAQDIVQRLRECYWFAGSNLIEGEQTNKFKFTNDNTVLYYDDNTNAFVNIGTWAVVVVGMERKLELSLTEPYQNLTGLWVVIQCAEDFISLVNGDNVLHLEQECFEPQNPFECFEGTVLEACDDSDGVAGDGVAKFDLTSIIENAQCEAEFNWSFHETVADAENDTNAISNPEAYIQQNGFVILRIEKPNGNFMLYDVGLSVESCDNTACTEEDVDNILKECPWKITSYNGSDDLSIYELDFNLEQELVITNLNTNETSVGSWMTFTGDNGVDITFENIAVPNLQAIGGIWTVVECTAEQLILHRGEDQITLDRVCG
ncbi:hypothetical protein [Winogradskyella sp. A3E31]|uniref:hypothetical protein n=1 Tax=Winogradskyella sp. A3E31 TaxID=3349637 RepID=UPI00398A7618